MAAERTVEAETTCPSCGEPVGMRAPFCMHCGRDLPERVEYDDVTGASASGETVTTGTASFLGRLRRLTRRGRDDDAAAAAGVAPDADRGVAPDATAGTSDGTADANRVPVPSGSGSDGPALLGHWGLLDRPLFAAKFLGGLGGLGVAGVAGLGLELPQAGVLLAVLAWAVSVVVLARRRSGFDAMRYGTYSLMVMLVFVSFALAFGAEGDGLLSLGLALVPVGVAALFVGGFGYTLGATEAQSR